jgi:hypothetical protein
MRIDPELVFPPASISGEILPAWLAALKTTILRISGNRE